MANVCINDTIIVGGVDISDHVTAVSTTHRVGDVVTATVEIVGVRIEDDVDDSGRQRHIFHLAEEATG